MATRKTAAKPTAANKERRAAAKLRKLRSHAETQVEEYLRGVGFEDPSELKDRGSYLLDLGEVVGSATVQAIDGEMTYTVSAEVLPLPSDRELVVPLLRELLELNAEIRGPARLAVVGDTVFAGVQDPVELMPDPDFGRYIDATLGVAHGAMKRLVKKYGKTVRKRGR